MLSKCPQCNYSLTGLPTNHVCPECGLEYDELTVCIKPSMSRRHVGNLWAGTALAAIVWWWSRDLLFVGILGVALAVELYLALRSASHGVRIVMNARGVVFNLRGKLGSVVPWDSIRRAKCRMITPTFEVQRTDDGPAVVFHVDKLGGSRKARRCAVEINRQKERRAEEGT